MATFTFRLTAQGVEELKRDLEALGTGGQQAFDRLIQASPQLSNALRTAEQSVDRTRESLQRLAQQEVDRLAAKFVPLARETQRYRAELAELARAHQLGVVTGAEYEQALIRINEELNPTSIRAREAAAAEAALEREARDLIETIEPLARAQRLFNEELARADRLLEAGKISYEQHAIAAFQARERLQAVTVQTTAAGRATRLTSADLLQLSQQFQDFAIQVASGQNPLLALAQQGSQVSFILGGFSQILPTIRQGVTALTAAVRANPLLAAGTALTAAVAAGVAGLYAFRNATKEAEGAQEDLNDRLDEAIRLHTRLNQQIELTAKARAAGARAQVELQQQEIRRLEEELERERERVREQLLARQEAAGVPGAPAPDPDLVRRTVEMADSVREAREAVAEAERELVFLNARLGIYDDLATRSATASEVLGNTIQDLGEETETASRRARTFADVLAELNEEAARNRAQEYAQAIALIESTIEAGLTDQERYEQQVREVNRALELAASRGYRLSAEAAERLNRALREADPAYQAQIEAARKAAEERQRIAEEEAELLQRPFERAADRIEGTLTDAIARGLRGGLTSARDVFNALLDIAAQTAAEMISLFAFRPAIGGIIGGFAPGFASAVFGGAGGLLPSTAAATQAINAFGASLGFANPVAVGAAIGGAGGPINLVHPSMQAGAAGFLGTTATLSQVLGAGGLGLLGGGLLAGMTGGNQLGGSIGGGLGAALGFAVGGPVGGIIGGLGGSLLGGLFGGDKPTPNASTSITLNAGRLVLGRSLTDQGGDASVTEAFAEQAIDAINRILESIGARIAALPAGSNALRFVGRTPELHPIVGGQEFKFQEGREAQALADFVRRILEESTLTGLTEIERQVVERTGFRDPQRLAENIQFARWFEALQDGADEADAFAQAMRALEEQFAEAGRRAAELGLNTNVIVRGFEDAAGELREQLLAPIDAFLAGLETSPLAPGTPLDRLAAAREQFRDIAERARAGESEAIAAFPAAAQQLLQLGQDVHASTGQFVAIFNEVREAAQSIRESVAAQQPDTKAVVDAIREAQQAAAAQAAAADKARRDAERRREQQLDDMRRELNLLRQQVQRQGSSGGGFRFTEGGGNGRR